MKSRSVPSLLILIKLVSTWQMEELLFMKENFLGLKPILLQEKKKESKKWKTLIQKENIILNFMTNKSNGKWNKKKKIINKEWIMPLGKLIKVKVFPKLIKMLMKNFLKKKPIFYWDNKMIKREFRKKLKELKNNNIKIYLILLFIEIKKLNLKFLKNIRYIKISGLKVRVKQRRNNLLSICYLI